jgi:hydrogenase-4 component B
MIATTYWVLLLLYLAGIATALWLPGETRARLTALSLAAVASGLAVIVGSDVLAGAPPPSGHLDTGLPLGPLTVALDPLSAFFLVVIGMLSLATAVYAMGYLARHAQHRTLRPTLALFNLLLLSLIVVVSAADAVLFLIAWEMMAFLSYLAVNFEYEDPRVTRAGYLMLAIGEVGTVGIIAAILFLAQAGGGFSFTALRLGAAHLDPQIGTAVFLCALFGFGAKAGLLPLQLWLPEAHPAAPSHISALLSAVIVNLGLYGLLRFLIDMLVAPQAWWGLLLLTLGALTAFVGILYALVQRDLKRVLAYSTIENMGLIMAALGLSLTYRAYGLQTLAAITGIFALYHLLNHAVYKGLLFLGAGALDYATGTRDLEQLGGLMHRMRWTATVFLVGSLAIAAVPPFAGYISEWGILETLLQSFSVPATTTRLVVEGAGALLALTAALAITTFVRAYAVAFLGLPRSDSAAAATEVPRSMRVAMVLLTIVCLALGAFPAFVVTGLNQVATPLWRANVLDQVVPPLFTNHPGSYALLVSLGGALFRGLPVNGLVIIPSPQFSTISSPTYLILWGALLLGLLAGVVRAIRPLGRRRIGPVWAGGIPRFTCRMQYSAMSYSNPARLIFRGIYRSHAEFVPLRPAARDGDGSLAYRQEVPPPFERVLYRPALRAGDFLAAQARWLQSGNINQYVSYIFLIVLATLLLRIL